MKEIIIVNGDDTFTFDAIDIGTIEGWEFPITRHVIEDLPSKDGAHYVTSKFGRRRLSFIGRVRGDCYAERRKLSAISAQGNLKELKFTTFDDLDLQAEVEVVNLLNPYSMFNRPLQMELVAPDWRFYSQTLYSDDTGETVFAGGFAIPFAIPFAIGGATSSPMTVYNAGNERSNPTFTIHGPGTTFTIRNSTNGQSMQLAATILVGETITINTLNQTITKNATNLYSTFSGDRDWVELDPGNNSFDFVAVSGTDANTRLAIEWRDAYRGV